jgi:hypothetical protein
LDAAVAAVAVGAAAVGDSTMTVVVGSSLVGVDAFGGENAEVVGRAGEYDGPMEDLQSAAEVATS